MKISKVTDQGIQKRDVKRGEKEAEWGVLPQPGHQLEDQLHELPTQV